MSGWLSDDVLRILEHAGYVAIPKERVKTFYAEQAVDRYASQMFAPEVLVDYERSLRRRLADCMAHTILQEGLLDIQLYSPVKGEPFITHRAELTVLMPRTVKSGD
jgi:hypothetical protein